MSTNVEMQKNERTKPVSIKTNDIPHQNEQHIIAKAMASKTTTSALSVLMWVLVLYSFVVSTYLVSAGTNSECKCTESEIDSALQTLGYSQLNPTTTKEPSDSPSRNPTNEPTTNPSKQPSNSLSQNPTNNPSKIPSHAPTENPSSNPSETPSFNPTSSPSSNPSETPSSDPSSNPSFNPSETPSSNPSFNPTDNPSNTPTRNPSESPSNTPTNNPSLSPTTNPSNDPSINPTEIPTNVPTNNPTNNPSGSPTELPTCTNVPTSNPTRNPTKSPTLNPSQSPSNNPTTLATDIPSMNPTTEQLTVPPTHNPTAEPSSIIVQIQHIISHTKAVTATSGWVEPSTDYRITITPKYLDSEILITYNFQWNPYVTGNGWGYVWSTAKSTDGGTTFYRDTITSTGEVSGYRNPISGISYFSTDASQHHVHTAHWITYDYPNTTQEIIYTVQLNQYTTAISSIVIGQTNHDNNIWGFTSPVTVIAMEIKQ